MENGKIAIAASALAIGVIAALVLVGTAIGASVTYSDTRILQGASSSNYYYKVVPEGFTIYLPSENGGILSFKVWNDQGTCYYCNTDNTLYYLGSSLRLNTTSKDINERLTSSIYNIKFEPIGDDKSLVSQGVAGGKTVEVRVQAGTSKVTLTTSKPSYNLFMELSDVSFTKASSSQSQYSMGEASRTGLVAEYHFDGDAKDSSGNGNDGIINGATFVEGISGQALSFDGNDDYVEVPDANSFHATSAQTLMAYIKIDAGTNYNVYDYRHIISKGATYGALYADFAMGLSNPDGKLHYESNDVNSQTSRLIGDTSISQGTWHQVAVTYETGTVKLYIDGKLDKTGSIPVSTLRTSAQPIYLGARYKSPVKGSFQGIIDEIKIYNRALSSEEIKAIYEGKTISPQPAQAQISSNTITRTGLVAEYHFDGDAKDSSGNRNDGNIYGATFVDGKFGKALSFNGVSDYVKVGGSYSIAGARTVSAWVYPRSNTELGLPVITGGPTGSGDFFGIAGTSGNCNVGQYELYIDHWATPCYDSNMPVTPNAWNHVAFTYDGSKIYFYVNGIPRGQISNNLYNYNINTYNIGGNNIGGTTTKTSFNGMIDDFLIYNRALSDAEIKAIYEGKPITSQPASTYTPAATAASPASQPVSSGFILQRAGNYKVLLDSDPTLLDSATLSRGSYYVVSYSNLLPYAGGIEVLFPDGKKITSESEVEPVFTSIAWKEASSQLKPSDIQTLRDILQTSRDIDSAISPVVQVTGPTVSSINSLKSACVSIPFVGKKCAWDAVKASVQGIDSLASQLESFNSELNQWKSAASSVGTHLPNAISGIEQAKSGGDINTQLQSEISQSLSDFGTLQSKTNQMSGRLSSISSSLSSAESGLRSAASTPVVGSLISPVADAVGSMRSEVNNLKGKADSFSRSMGEQSSKLSAVTETANKRTSELKSLWNARQNAEARIYGTIFGVIGVLILIVAIIFVRKKKASKMEVKQEAMGVESDVKEVKQAKIEEKSTEDAKVEEKEPIKEIDTETEKYLGYGKQAILKLNNEIAESENSLVTMQNDLQKTEDLLKKVRSRCKSGEISKETLKEMEKKYKNKISNLKNSVEQADNKVKKLREIKGFIEEKKEKR